MWLVSPIYESIIYNTFMNAHVKDSHVINMIVIHNQLSMIQYIKFLYECNNINIHIHYWS